MTLRNQLFIVSRAARESLTPSEVNATVEALRELNLYALPYPLINVWIAADGYAQTVLDDRPLIEGAVKTVRNWVEEGIMTLDTGADGHERAIANFGEGGWVEYTNVSLEGIVPCYRYLHFEGNRAFPNQRLALEPGQPIGADERFNVANGLIVLLATRNAVKTIEHHKAAGLGIGAKKKGRRSYEYVTTITVPAEAELPSHEGEGRPTGAARVPHLRRGHIRRQRFGPRHELIKRVWIAPVFVNADKDWVAQRRAYNMSF